jgi:hypothetical protein
LVQIWLNGASFAACSADGCPMTYLFEGAQCTGTMYQRANDSLVQDASVIDDRLLYPVGPAAMRSTTSSGNDAGICQQINDSEQAVEVRSIPLSDLGLVAPFHLAR